MQNTDNTILHNHQDKLEAKFEHISLLLQNGNIQDAASEMLELHYADLADFLDATNHKLYDLILPEIAEKIHPETIVWLHDSNKQPVIKSLGVKHAAAIINQLGIEDAIEVLDQIDQEIKDEILNFLDEKTKQQILEGFTYPDKTVGRVLEKNFISLRNHWTAGQAIDYIRRSNFNQDFHAAIVIDERNTPVGNILLSTLLKSSRTSPLTGLMNPDFKIAYTNTELAELVFIFKQYALTIVPVINKKGKLVGTISIDNMIYIIEEQTESEMMNLGGLSTTDIFDNFYESAKHRFPWLFVNLLSACLTSVVINQFADTIFKLITLAAIMPIVASMGGNAGTQAMTITVRALANREINNVNRFKVITKETFVCFVNGVVLSVIGFALTYFLFFNFYMSLVFALSVVINFAAAGLIGSGIPILLNHYDIDPATASGVFLTALTDALGFFSFLGLAFFFLI